MLTQILDVVHIETVRFQAACRHADRIDLAARENVFDQRLIFRAFAAHAPATVLHPLGDGMMKIDAVWFQQPAYRGKISGVVGEPDMLEHADRRNLVKTALKIEV